MSWASPEQERPIVCGHRGAPAVLAENTMASFQAAIDRGATWIEFDVRPTSDGSLVIHHDADTAEGIDIGASPRAALRDDIPDFAELLSAFPSVGLDIEMKVTNIGIPIGTYVDYVLDEIERTRPSIDNLLVTSFSPKALKAVRERRPDMPTGLLIWKRSVEWGIKTAAEDGHVAIGPDIAKLDEAVVTASREHGLDVLTWTVNTPEQIRKALDLGVDMIVGDDPAVIIEHLS